MRARAHCHACSRFIPLFSLLTKDLPFQIRCRAACRRQDLSLHRFVRGTLTYIKGPSCLTRMQSILDPSIFLCVLRPSTLRLPTWRQIAVRPVRPQFLVLSSFFFVFRSFVLVSCSPTRRDRVFCGALSSICRPLPSILTLSRSIPPATTFMVLAACNREGLSLSLLSLLLELRSSRAFELPRGRVF
jgi:hypothetical protein